MFTVGRHSISTSSTVEEVLRQLKMLVYSNTAKSIAELQRTDGKPFTGKIAERQFRISHIQRGRIVPLPVTVGTVLDTEDGSQILLRSKPSLNAFINLVVFAVVGFVLIGVMVLGERFMMLPIALFPFGVVAISVHLLRRECQRTYDVIEQALSQRNATVEQ